MWAPRSTPPWKPPTADTPRSPTARSPGYLPVALAALAAAWERLALPDDGSAAPGDLPGDLQLNLYGALMRTRFGPMRFAAGTRDPNSFLARDTGSTERFAGPSRKLESPLKEPDGTRRLSMYLEPPSGSQPRVVARVHERYLVTGQNQLDGDYEVIVQVEALLRHGETENIVRIMGSGCAAASPNHWIVASGIAA